MDPGLLRPEGRTDNDHLEEKKRNHQLALRRSGYRISQEAHAATGDVPRFQ